MLGAHLDNYCYNISNNNYIYIKLHIYVYKKKYIVGTENDYNS